MSKTNLYLIMLSICLVSCKESNLKKLSPKDSAEIVSNALNSKLFLKDNIETDTIHFLKNNYYNQSWPEKTQYFRLFYIEDTKDTHTINTPSKPVDRRTRISPFEFKLEKNTVYLTLFDYGVQATYDFKLKKTDGVWKTVFENYQNINSIQ